MYLSRAHINATIVVVMKQARVGQSPRLGVVIEWKPAYAQVATAACPEQQRYGSLALVSFDSSFGDSTPNYGVEAETAWFIRCRDWMIRGRLD